MSGLSNVQKNSLAGQILSKLTNAEGKIDRQKWNSLWEQNSDYKQGKPETNNIGEGDIDIQEAFKYIMTRIFNAAKKELNWQEWSVSDNNGRSYLTSTANNKINEAAKELLKKADNVSSSSASTTIRGNESEEDTVETVIANTQAKTGEANTAKNAADVAYKAANTALQQASNAETQEDANTLIEEAKKQFEEADKQIKKAEQKAQEAQSLLDTLEEDETDEDYISAKSALEQAIKAIGELKALISPQIASLTQTIEAANKKAGLLPTKEVAEQAKVEAQIKETEEFLAQKGAKKESKRLINGTEQEYYKYNEDGKTIRVLKTETGKLDELIQIAGGNLRKKQFITVSQLRQATGNNDIAQIPEGITCECKIENDAVVLTFKDENGPIEASKVPNYPDSLIDDEFKAQLKDIDTGVQNVPEYSIAEDGALNITIADYSQIVNIDSSYFSSINHKISDLDEKGFYHKGPLKQKLKKNDDESKKLAQTQLNNKYNSYVQQLSVRAQIYKDLLNKPAEELSVGEKAFMKMYERQAYNFVNS